MTGTGTASRLTRSRHLARPHDTAGLRAAIMSGCIAFLVLLAAGSLYDVRLLTLMMAAGVAICLATLVLRAPVMGCAAWLIVAGTSPEFWLGEMLPGYENTITAFVKMAGLALVGVCILLYGARFDAFNPALAFVVMFVIGLTHDPMPGATRMESVRSLIGAAAPFAFSFSRLSRRWCRAIIEATIWVSPIIVVFGVVIAAAGLRPLMTALENRLEASTHPAFLGGFAMAGMYAALLELYRDGRASRLWALAANFAILIATGARAPLACVLVVCASAFLLLTSDAFPLRRRVPLMLGGLLLLPVMVALATGGSSLRLLNVLSGEAGDLSGRDIIWPYFAAAWRAAPIFGWGVGASKAVMDPDSLIVRLLGTTAAHNEYLRIGVDGGYVGLALLIGMMTLWAISWTRRMRRTDRFIMRAVFLCFAVHSITDNTLIAATASVLFAWVSTVFARAALEAEAPAPPGAVASAPRALAHVA